MIADSTSQALLAADRECLDAAEVFLDSLTDHPSPVGFARLLERIRAAREREQRAGPGSAFEGLLARHLLAGWRLLEKVASYRFDPSSVPVADLLAALAADDALERLERYVAGIDQDEVWSYLESRHRYRGGRVPAGHPEARRGIEVMAGTMAGAFRQWMRESGYDLPGLDAEVIVGSDQADHSWYQPRRHLVVLGGNEFMVFEQPGGLRVNPLSALHSLAHELAGHAVQDALCRELPDALRPDDRSRLRFSTLPAAEGFAAFAARLAVDFAGERGESIGLEAADVAFLRRMTDLTPMHHALPALANALAARAKQERGFDPVAHMAELCGQAGHAEMLAAAAGQPCYKLIYEASCFFGIEMVTHAAAQLTARGVEDGAALRILGRGAWTPACYADAILADENRDRPAE